MSSTRKPKILINWWFVLLEAVLVRYVRVSEQWLNQVREAAQQGSVIFILRNRNIIDFLCLRGICKRHNLPPLGFVSGLSRFSFIPLWKLLFSIFVPWDKKRQVSRLVQTWKRGGCGVVFLRRPALRNAIGSRPTAVNGIELALIAQKELNQPVIALPTVFLWGEAPMKRTRSNLSYIFGTAEYPRLLRSIWLLIRRRSVHEIITEKPILVEELKKNRGDDIQRLQGIIRATVGRRIEAIRTQKLGSFKKASSRVKFEVTQSHRLLRELEKISEEENIPKKEIPIRTKTIIEKLATDFKPHVLAGFAVLMMFLWKKIYSGLEIQKDDLDKIREAVGKGPLLLIPCHRSHIDYLAISEAMNSANIMLPHIAAGDNLAFWPMGFFFRSCGAFFIRRKFVNDKFYRAVVNAYIRKLIQEKYAIEVFIEGGRSRTGKMLRPKLGMLEMALHAMASIPGRNPGVLPVFIGYDKVIEEESYIREAMGKKKKSESVFGLLKSAGVLTHNYGKLYVRSGRFFTIRDILDQMGHKTVELTDGTIRRNIAQEIGRKTLLEINRNAVATLNAVVATVILSAPKSATLRQLQESSIRYIQMLDAASLPISKECAQLIRVTESDRESLFLKIIGRFAKDKRLILHGKLASDATIEIKATARMGLDYYKNTSIHFVIPASLLAPTLHKNTAGCTRAELRETICLMSKLYKWEFLLPDPKKCTDCEIEQVVDDGIHFLLSSEIIRRENDVFFVSDAAQLSYLAGALRTFHEIYHCALWVSRERFLHKNVSNASSAARKRFEAELKTGFYQMPEGQNRITFQSAFSAIKDLKLNRPGKDERPYDIGGIGHDLFEYLETAMWIFKINE
ncbi:MAG: 1-acyl-sn-glycerol-3-phosphate acyltransferase [Deltaproteobacteria bacterium]|nr:1-acyl-sn-glycerol-3-phosphate acyltransferase [Deltaproteobacteria bacterium]MBN2674462.1 1-acyl-sn-glycerol-3-phosphate acyltransferase [Deltaproteobacteria bacterium]